VEAAPAGAVDAAVELAAVELGVVVELSAVFEAELLVVLELPFEAVVSRVFEQAVENTKPATRAEPAVTFRRGAITFFIGDMGG
jgi:hypothetical protein